MNLSTLFFSLFSLSALVNLLNTMNLFGLEKEPSRTVSLLMCILQFLLLLVLAIRHYQNTGDV